MLKGNERFLRGNRSRRDFVGSDRAEQTSFVGAQQALATGRVRPATEGLRIDATNSRRINRPIAPVPNKGMYHPRLELDWNAFSVESDPSDMRNAATYDRLQQRVQRIGGTQVQVVVNGFTAVLHGSVDSVRTAELLEQMLQFEPGIDEVQSLIEVQPDRN